MKALLCDAKSVKNNVNDPFKMESKPSAQKNCFVGLTL